MVPGVVNGPDIDLLVQQLDHFYQKNEQKKENKINEFSIENLYGKRTQKEIEFIQKMGDLNRKDLKLNSQLSSLNDRWSKGAGMGKKFYLKQLEKHGKSPKFSKGTKVAMF